METELKVRSTADHGSPPDRSALQSPRKALPPALDEHNTASDALAIIARSTLEHLRANEQGVLAGDDPEFLHQMRVALRRLRSALSAFSRALPAKARAPVIRDLTRLGAALGPARDWDVFMTETLPAIREAFPERAALALLSEEFARLRVAAQGNARRAIRSRKYQRVMIGLASWLAAQAWREHADAGSVALLGLPVRAHAQSELERRYERVRERGRKLKDLSAPELHQLRIAIKKMRYTIDFFASLFDADAVRGLRSRLSRLQDVLGTLNDAATTARLVENALADSRAGEPAEARGIVFGWSAGRADALKRDLNRSWRAFRRNETFW